MTRTKRAFKNFSTGYTLAGIILFGFMLRVWGIGFGLPNLYHADEPIVVNHALAYGTGDFNPHFFRIPPLVSYVLFFIYGVLFAAAKGLHFFNSVQDFERLFYADPTLFYFAGRFLLGVIPGTLSIYLLFKLSNKIAGLSTALLAAFLFSVSFLHVRDSHYIYADIPLLLCLIAGFFSITAVLDRGLFDWRVHLTAGLWVGAASAVKYNGILLFLPYAAAVLQGACTQSSAFKKAGCLFVSAAAAAAFFLILNPFALLDWKFFISELQGEAAARSSGAGWTHHLTYSLSGALGLPMLFSSLAGGAVILMRPRAVLEKRVGVVIVLFIGIYYAVLVRAGQHYDRYVLPLLPFMCFLSAYSLTRLNEAARFIALSKHAQAVVKGTLILVIAAVPLYKSVKCNFLFQTKDLRTEAADWIESHIPSGAKIAMETPFYMPRLLLSEEILTQKLLNLDSLDSTVSAQKRRLNFKIEESRKRSAAYHLYILEASAAEAPRKAFLMSPETVNYDLESVKSKGIQYLIAVDLPHSEPAKSFWENVRKSARLEMRFTPYKNNDTKGIFDVIALTGAPFTWRELAARRSNGQPLEIYKI